MHDKTSKKKATFPLTLRADRALLMHYEEIAARANRILLARGERSNVTVQQVILHRMRSLPSWQARRKRLNLE